MHLSPFTTGYAAAGGSLFSHVMAGFLANSGTATEDISPSRRILVSRARMLDISCPMATAAVDRMVHGVLGDGLSYSIGNSDFFERDEYQALCGGLKKSLKLASMTHTLDIQGRLTFAQMQRMACRNWLLSGDVFFVRRPNRTNCAWRIIESDRCMTPEMFTTTLSGLKATNPDNGNTIIDGVELDNEARPVAYWFLNHYAAFRGMCEFDGYLLNIITYSRSYKNSSGVRTPYLPTDFVCVTAPNCGRTLCGGTTHLAREAVATEDIGASFVSKSGKFILSKVDDFENNELKIRVESRPLPVPRSEWRWITALVTTSRPEP